MAPGPLTRVKLANRALASIGAGVLTTLDQAMPPGPAVALVYDTAIDGLLAEYPWTFTKQTVQLTPSAQETPDASGFLMAGWRYAYVPPSDLLQPPEKYLTDPRLEGGFITRFAVQNNLVYCDAQSLYAVCRVRADEDVWPPYFVAAAVAVLAAEIAPAITGAAEALIGRLQANAWGTPDQQRCGGKLGAAKTIDAQNSGVESLALDQFVALMRNG